MAKRTKQPTIKLQQRNDWLKRFENGESIFKIATNDECDPRTVRKHVELAKEAREAKEARAAVLRDAVEKHYADLVNLAENWSAQIQGLDQVHPSLDFDLLEKALRQHLPRSPLWANRQKWESLHQRREEESKKLAADIEVTVRNESRVTLLRMQGLGRVGEGLTEILARKAEQVAQGLEGLALEQSLVSEPAGDGKLNMRCGFAQIGQVEKEREAEFREDLKRILTDLQSKVRDLESFLDVEKTYQEIDQLKPKLREELAIIRLRRIVPGRCQFCPL